MGSVFPEPQCDRRVALVSMHIDIMRSIIVDDFQLRGSKALGLYEYFIEVCSSLLYLGDICRYFDVDDNGFVDFEGSYEPFMEQFVPCLIMMHEWCIRHSPSGQSPQQRCWITKGVCGKVLTVNSFVSPVRVSRAVYPHTTDGEIDIGAIRLLSNSKLLEKFVASSKLACGVVRHRPDRPFQFLTFAERVRSVEFYFTGSTVSRGSNDDGEALVLRLSPVDGGLNLSGDSEWENFWSFQASSMFGSVYDDVKSLLKLQRVSVG